MSRRRDPPNRPAQHPDAGSAARSAEESLGKLTAEHLALRRVAELVAKGAPPGELFDAVAVEASRLIKEDTSLLRVERRRRLRRDRGLRRAGPGRYAIHDCR